MSGAVVILRLHRMVRHGYRPWLGYDVASSQDRDIHLRRKDGNATIQPDGSVRFEDGGIAADDAAGFDARLPPNTPNKRNIWRRLYEIGL